MQNEAQIETDYLVDTCEFSSLGRLVWRDNVCHFFQWRKENPKQQNLEIDKLSPYQNFLYRRVLFGLNVYVIEELKVMHYDKKERVRKVHQRAQIILNLWKQQIINQYFNLFIQSKFKPKAANEFLSVFPAVTDPNFINTFDFKQLKVTKEKIIDKLMAEGILSKDFYQQKIIPVSQPKLRLRAKKEAL